MHRKKQQKCERKLKNFNFHYVANASQASQAYANFNAAYFINKDYFLQAQN